MSIFLLDMAFLIKNQTRKLSLFLALVAECLSENSGLFGMNQMSLLENINIKHDKLDPLILNLQGKTDSSENQNANIIEFLEEQKGLTELVKTLSSNISTINLKVEKNIEAHISNTFGGSQ
jgi:hypothetical protein